VLLLPPLLQQSKQEHSGLGGWEGRSGRGGNCRAPARSPTLPVMWSRATHPHLQLYPSSKHPSTSSSARPTPTPTTPHVCPYSSPMTIMGTPWATSSAVIMLRIWRWRRVLTAGLSVGPSAPQFQLRLCCSPSLRAMKGRKGAEEEERGGGAGGRGRRYGLVGHQVATANEHTTSWTLLSSAVLLKPALAPPPRLSALPLPPLLPPPPQLGRTCSAPRLHRCASHCRPPGQPG
jgi:hypothetical protein